MNTKFAMKPLAAAFLVAMTLPAHAEDTEVYKWRDASGHVNYSNVPTRSEARVATPVEAQISVIPTAARAAAEKRQAARLARQDRAEQSGMQTLVVQPAGSEEVIMVDGAIQTNVDGVPTGYTSSSEYRRALNRAYRRSLQNDQASTNAPSQAANRQRAQAAATAQAQAANNPQQSVTSRQAARVNADRNANFQGGTNSSGTAGGTTGGTTTGSSGGTTGGSSGGAAAAR